MTLARSAQQSGTFSIGEIHAEWRSRRFFAAFNTPSPRSKFLKSAARGYKTYKIHDDYSAVQLRSTLMYSMQTASFNPIAIAIQAIFHSVSSTLTYNDRENSK